MSVYTLEKKRKKIVEYVDYGILFSFATSKFVISFTVHLNYDPPFTQMNQF